MDERTRTTVPYDDSWVVSGARGPVHVQTWEPAERPSLVAVLVHGYADHGGRFDGVARALAAQGTVVHAPDQRGAGRSGGERALVHDYADVVHDVELVVATARRRHPDAPLLLLGHSIGAAVAARVAQRRAVDPAGLVLVAPVLGAWRTAEMLLGLGDVPMVPMDVSSMMSRDPAAVAAYASDDLVWHGSFRRPTLEAIVALLRAVDEGGRLGPLPTLWMHGTGDLLAPIPEVRPGVERIAGPELVERIYPDALHALFHDVDADRAVADLIAFAGTLRLRAVRS